MTTEQKHFYDKHTLKQGVNSWKVKHKKIIIFKPEAVFSFFSLNNTYFFCLFLSISLLYKNIEIIQSPVMIYN